jgi:hypothetical protein
VPVLLADVTVGLAALDCALPAPPVVLSEGHRLVMGGVDAGAHVAGVVDGESGADRAQVQLVADAVRERQRTAGAADDAVAVTVLGSAPDDAAARPGCAACGQAVREGLCGWGRLGAGCGADVTAPLGPPETSLSGGPLGY